MIDYNSKRVIQQDLEHDGIQAVYSFEDTVPVLIWEGKCAIDFKEMFGHISFLWESWCSVS